MDLVVAEGTRSINDWRLFIKTMEVFLKHQTHLRRGGQILPLLRCMVVFHLPPEQQKCSRCLPTFRSGNCIRHELGGSEGITSSSVICTRTNTDETTSSTFSSASQSRALPPRTTAARKSITGHNKWGSSMISSSDVVGTESVAAR